MFPRVFIVVSQYIIYYAVYYDYVERDDCVYQVSPRLVAVSVSYMPIYMSLSCMASGSLLRTTMLFTC